MRQGLAFKLGAILFISIIILAGCDRQRLICDPDDSTSSPKPALADLIALPPPPVQAEPITVEIGGKMIAVDRLVTGPLCNDSWSGTVYVGCDAVVGESKLDPQENPLFFKGCGLEIQPGTVVYVAAHNDAAYYKGCSCHTGEDPVP